MLSLLQLSVATCLLTFCHLTTAQVPFPNHCPEVKVVPEFDLDAYMGIWYEYSKYPFVFEIGKKCMYARYGNVGNNTVSVMNAAINRLTGQHTNVTGKATVIAPGQLAVTFSRNQNATKPNYLVLGTDYTNFVVVYSCSNFTPYAHTKIVWILTRERIPTEETVRAARKIMDDNNLSQSFLMNTIQDTCPAPDADADADADGSASTVAEFAGGDSEAAGTDLNFEYAHTEQSNMIDKA